MLTSISFEVPGVAVPKARPRVTERGAYTPRKSADYEKHVAQCAALAVRGAGVRGLSGAIEAFIDVVLPIPASWSRAKRRDALEGRLRPTGRPDLDNIVKAVKDGMNGVMYADDSAIWYLLAMKMYGETPLVRITVKGKGVEDATG